MKRNKAVSSQGDRQVFSQALEAQLTRLLASDLFKSPRHQLLLRTIVSESLAGRADALKEVVLARDIFNRPDYDPSRHTLVRVEVNALRRKLAEYYTTATPADHIRIHIPRGHYVAEFSTIPETSTAPSRPRWHYLLVLGLLILISVSACWLALRPQPSRQEIPSQITFDTGWTAQPAVSRDGVVLVYSSDRGPRADRDIWIQQRGQPARQLTNGPAHDMTPDISPDGAQIAFRSWRQPEGIWIIPAAGGEAKPLAKGGYSPRYSPDGKWLTFYAAGMDETAHIFVIPAAGGVPERIDYGTREAGCPVWSPDGSEIVFEARSINKGEFDFWIANAQGERNQLSRQLGLQAMLAAEKLPRIYSNADCAQDWIDGRLFFVTHRGQTSFLFQASLTPAGKISRLEAVPSAIGAEGVRAIHRPVGPIALLFAIERRQANIWTTDLSAAAPLQQTTHDSSLISGFDGTWPALSGDGNVLAYITERSGSPDICLKNLRTGAEQLLSAPTFSQSPLFLDRTGSRIVFVSRRGSHPQILLRNIAQKTDQIITSNCPTLHDWSRDGDLLLCADGGSLFQFQIGKAKEKPLLALLQAPMRAQFSPDCQWLSFVTETGQGEATAGFVAPLDGSNRRIAICEGIYGLSLHWAPDGNALYYWSLRDGFRCLYLQPLDPKTKIPLGDPVAILHRHASQSYPWSGGTLSVSSTRMAMTLKDESANIWEIDLPR